MNTRAVAADRSPPGQSSMWLLRITNSKNPNRSMAGPMNAANASAPTSSTVGRVTSSSVMATSAANTPSSSSQARRLTRSA